jgi:endonuclease/exonuclease/phosphatase family metal-dependent hydrolase
VLLLSAFFASCVGIPVPDLEPLAPEAARVTSLNIRYVNTDSEDPLVRADAVAAYLRDTEIDIVMLQEVATVQGHEVVSPDPIAARLAELLPEYGWIRPLGVARLSGSNPILYDLDRYMPIKQGIVWMSETPDMPDSRGWGNDIPRFGTWTILYDNAGGDQLFVMNVHLDHLSQPMNRRAAHLILDVLQDEADALPVVLGGDFNSLPGGSVRGSIEDELSSVLNWTHGPTHLTFPQLQIDGIYVSSEFNVLEAFVDPTPVDGPITSDHAAVVAEVMLADSVTGGRRSSAGR